MRTGWSGRLGVIDCMLAVGALLLLIRQAPGAADDPGLGWHLETGEWIVAHAGVPLNDPFLAPAGREWVADQWLADVLMYLAHAHAGWPGLYGLVIAIFLLAYFVVLYPALTRLTHSPLAAALVSCAALKVGQLHFVIRPVVFGFLFFAIVAVVLQTTVRRFAEGGTPLCRREYAGMAALFALWSNMHPSFVLGLVLVVLWALSPIAERLMGGAKPAANGSLRWRFVLLAACAAATLLNPNTYRLHGTVIRFGSSDFLMQLYNEWAPASFTEPPARILEAMAGLIAIAVFLAARLRRADPPPGKELRFGAFDLLTVVCFFHLALQAVRMLPFAAIAAAFPAAEGLVFIASFLAQKFPHALRLVRRLMLRVERYEQGARPGAAPLLAVLAVEFSALFLQVVPGLPAALAPSGARCPQAALRRLQRSCSGDAVILASPDFGGCITWVGWPHLRAVIDDRSSLLGESAYKAFFEKVRPGGGWRQYLHETKATHLMLRDNSFFARYLRKFGGLPIAAEEGGITIFEAASCRKE